MCLSCFSVSLYQKHSQVTHQPYELRVGENVRLHEKSEGESERAREDERMREELAHLKETNGRLEKGHETFNEITRKFELRDGKRLVVSIDRYLTIADKIRVTEG